MTKRILITKEKGGVASTTTAVNLAYDLAQRGNRVLLVDMDTRGDCAACLGLDPAGGLYDVVRHVFGGDGSLLDNGAVRARPGLDLIRTNTTGTATVLDLLRDVPLLGVSNLLSDIGMDYDYLLFDTSAASGVLRRAAMQIADLMVIPTRLEALGMPDIASLIEAYGKRQRVIILPVCYRKLNVHQYNLSVLREAYGEPSFDGRVADAIPDRVAVIESHSAMRPVLEYEPMSDASVAYRALTGDVLALLEQERAVATADGEVVHG